MTQYISIALGVALLFGGWQYQRAENLKEANVKLKIGLDAQEQTIDYQRQRAAQDAETIKEWGDTNAAIRSETTSLAAQLNTLRVDEHKRSLAAPFTVGGNADDRRRTDLLRFVGQDDNQDDPASADTGDTE
mgnify:CR=1 FL=1